MTQDKNRRPQEAAANAERNKNNTNDTSPWPFIQATLANARNIYDATKGITNIPTNLAAAGLAGYAQTLPKDDPRRAAIEWGLWGLPVGLRVAVAIAAAGFVLQRKTNMDIEEVKKITLDLLPLAKGNTLEAARAMDKELERLEGRVREVERYERREDPRFRKTRRKFPNYRADLENKTQQARQRLRQYEWDTMTDEIEHTQATSPQADWAGINGDIDTEQTPAQTALPQNQPIQADPEGIRHGKQWEDRQATQAAPEIDPPPHTVQQAPQTPFAQSSASAKGLWNSETASADFQHYSTDPDIFLAEFADANPQYSWHQIVSGSNLYDDNNLRGAKIHYQELQEQLINSPAHTRPTAADVDAFTDNFIRDNPHYPVQSVLKGLQFDEDHKLRDFKNERRRLINKVIETENLPESPGSPTNRY